MDLVYDMIEQSSEAWVPLEEICESIDAKEIEIVQALDQWAEAGVMIEQLCVGFAGIFKDAKG